MKCVVCGCELNESNFGAHRWCASCIAKSNATDLGPLIDSFFVSKDPDEPVMAITPQIDVTAWKSHVDTTSSNFNLHDLVDADDNVPSSFYRSAMHIYLSGIRRGSSPMDLPADLSSCFKGSNNPIDVRA